MNAAPRFVPAARLLHWLMAVLILLMLFVGIGMVSTVSDLHSRLLGLHKPLGIAILLLALLRLAVRLRHRPPPLPMDLPAWQRLAAHASHLLLYALMLALPLVGWAMLGAGGYPVALGHGIVLPPLVPQHRALFALLLFGLVLLHLAAALHHAWVRRDTVFGSIRP